MAPPGRDTRPTSDRIREAIFSSLGAHVPGAVVLDLYAGSGALAIEALSRGADTARLVEQDRRAATAIERNLAATQLEERATLHRTTAERFCAEPAGGPFDVVLLDPPYVTTLPAVWARMEALHAAGALATGAVLAVERDKRDPHLDAAPPSFLAPDRRRSYGDTVMLYLRVE